MKKILITGGSGFVGRNLAEGLADRYEIFAPPHRELDIIDHSAVNRYVAEKNIDIIIHAAVHVPAFNGAEKELYNDMMMYLALEKLSGSVEKIICFGSGAEYDKRFDVTDVTEEDLGKRIPISEYGVGKYLTAKLIRTSDNIYNLRLFGIFGKYELWQLKFISNLCCKAVFGLPLTIRRDCLFNFLYVEDLPDIVDAFICGTPAQHDYNICHDCNYMLSELAEMVRTASGKNLDIVFLSPGRAFDYTASNARLRAEFKDLTITPIMQAIEELYRYYYDNRSIIDLEQLRASR